jgi:NADPH-dependent ferric siderophore reductase
VAPVTPGLLNVTLTGEGLDSFPAYCPAAHVKLFLPHPGQERPALPTLGPDGPVWPANEKKPIVRTYSVRSFRQAEREIDIEFAIHGVEGPASRFARNAAPGDHVGLSYPGGPDPMIPPAAHYFLAGDMSTVPALASILEHLPPHATGHVMVRADDAGDVRDLPRPEGMHLHWHVADPTGIAEMTNAFKALPLPTGGAFYWVGGEHALVVSLRKYLVAERHIAKDSLYALPYWRHTFDEEGYHQMRDHVMNQEPAE